MVKVTASGASGFDMRELDFTILFEGVRYVERRNLIEVHYGMGYVDSFSGTGFRYDSSGVPVGGTVKSYRLMYGDQPLVKIEGLNIAVTRLVAVAETASSADDNRFIQGVLSGNDTFLGSNGGDVVMGYGGNDRLDGKGGNDTLKGGTGNDILIGGGGKDTLFGNGGADTFVFNRVSDSGRSLGTADVIKDFSRAQRDRIDLSGIDADTKSAGNNAFKFIGDDEFHGKAGELRYEKSGKTTIVEGDVDGDGSADFVIKVQGAIDFQASDFIL